MAQITLDIVQPQSQNDDPNAANKNANTNPHGNKRRRHDDTNTHPLARMPKPRLPLLKQRAKPSSFAQALHPSPNWEEVQIYPDIEPIIKYRNPHDVLSWNNSALRQMHEIQANRRASNSDLGGWHLSNGMWCSDTVAQVNWQRLGLRFVQNKHNRSHSENYHHDYTGKDPIASSGRIILLSKAFTRANVNNKQHVVSILDTIAYSNYMHPIASLEHDEYKYDIRHTTITELEQLLSPFDPEALPASLDEIFDVLHIQEEKVNDNTDHLTEIIADMRKQSLITPYVSLDTSSFITGRELRDRMIREPLFNANNDDEFDHNDINQFNNEQREKRDELMQHLKNDIKVPMILLYLNDSTVLSSFGNDDWAIQGKVKWNDETIEIYHAPPRREFRHFDIEITGIPDTHRLADVTKEMKHAIWSGYWNLALLHYSELLRKHDYDPLQVSIHSFILSVQTTIKNYMTATASKPKSKQKRSDKEENDENDSPFTIANGKIVLDRLAATYHPSKTEVNAINLIQIPLSHLTAIALVFLISMTTRIAIRYHT
eukprot:242476_1